MPRKVTAKAKLKLTTPGLSEFTPSEGVEIVWDADIPGFGLRTRGKPDRRAWRWVYRYLHRSGRKVALTGGSPLTRTPEQARKWAKEAAKLANTSDDPYEAKRREREALSAERAKPTVAELWDQWRNAEGRLKKSAHNDASLWEGHLKAAFGVKKVASVTQADVAKFRDDLSSIPIRANRCIALLSRMFTKAVEWGYRAGCAPEHPIKGVKRNPENKVEFFYTDNELGRLLRAADEDASLSKGLAIRMLATTGARLSEVLTARWDQITTLEDGRSLWVVEASNTKTNRTIARILPVDLTERLDQWRPLSVALLARAKVTALGAPRWIFPSEADPGEPLKRNIWKAWERIKLRAGVSRGRIHDLRHTVATILTEETGGLEAAYHALGHATMLTTRRYAHLTAKARGQISDTMANRLSAAEERAKANAGADVVKLVKADL